VTHPFLPVVFTATARRHVERAEVWWAKNRPGAPDAIREELRAGLELVASQPACGGAVSTARVQGVRRILLQRIGYFLYYRVAPRKKRLEVLAFWHARRGKGPAV
jgi:plasmid stabilization system protein ParE